MSWKRWKRGLLVAVLTGMAKGLIGFVLGLTWPQIGILFATNIGADLALYLKQHPIDCVEDSTTLFWRKQADRETR